MPCLNERLKINNGEKFILGNDLTIAVVSLAASFKLMDSLEFDLKELKHMSAYLDALKTSIKDYGLINDKPIENLRKFFKLKQH